MHDALTEYRAQRAELLRAARRRNTRIFAAVFVLLLLTLIVAIDVCRSPIPSPENFDAAEMRREAARRAR